MYIPTSDNRSKVVRGGTFVFSVFQQAELLSFRNLVGHTSSLVSLANDYTILSILIEIISVNSSSVFIKWKYYF